ncbi:FUSC family protein [Rhodococcus ruber]|uniref:FUSC family protein n=1 Tax=Rhodococcus ruber TaxID=1830 RepID=A0ABT4MEM9_9NOCA|nr:FUSC family protein [Rhodococcus ruber]MCZ4519443.1 FUSC family protein [Rhodococcus ruber]
MLLPMLTLWATDHMAWSGYALLAAVIAVYARNASYTRRLCTQASVGLVQIVLITDGAALASASASPWLLVVLTAVVAGGGTILADRLVWLPPGSLFFVFAFAVSASAPAKPGSVVIAAALSTATVLLTLAVTAVSTVTDARRSAYDLRSSSARPVPWPLTALHSALCFVAAGAAGSASLALALGHWYWAMVAAIVPVVGPTTAGQILRAGHRIVGTAIGLVLSAALFWYPPHGLLLVIILSGLLIATELLVTRNYSLAMVFLTPTTIGLLYLFDTGPALGVTLWSRAVETVLGAAIAVALIYATHRIRHRVVSVR